MSRYLVLTLLALIVLTPQLHAEEEPTDLFVSGALSAEGMRHIGQPTSSLTGEELKKRRAGTIGETLALEPGVSSSSFGPGASRPIIRGQSNSRVRVLQNGVEVGDVSAASDDHVVSVDPLATEHIEIIRGPNTLLYGSQAIGGVVNIIDGAIAEEAIEKELTGSVDLRKGDSADDESAAAVKLQGQQGSINWHVSGFFRETDNIEIPGFAESEALRELEEAEEHEEEGGDEHGEEEEARGSLPSSDTLSRGFKVGASHIFENGFIGLSFGRNDSEYGVPSHGHAEEEGHDGEEEEGEEGVAIDLEQNRIESRGEYRFDHDFFKALRFSAVYSDYMHNELEGSEIGTTFKRDAIELRTLLTHKHKLHNHKHHVHNEKESFEGGFGFQINYDDTEITGDEAFIPSSETFAPAFFFIEDISLSEEFVFQFGGRYEHANIDPDSLQAESFNLFSGSTGVSWHDLSHTYTSGLSLTYSERSPNTTELFADGLHVGTQTFEIGNSDLDKERSVGAELNFGKVKGPLRFALSAFWQQYFDYINLSPAGEMREGAPVFFYDDIQAEFWGFEGSAEYDLFDTEQQLVKLYSTVDFVRGRNESDGTDLPRITPLRAKVGLEHQVAGVRNYVEGIFVDEQDDVAPFELPTDNYTLLQAGSTYRFTTDRGQDLELYIQGTNLTDEEARVHTSFLKDLAPLRGRAFFAGLRGYF